jgi:hypothetical protein
MLMTSLYHMGAHQSPITTEAISATIVTGRQAYIEVDINLLISSLIQ